MSEEKLQTSDYQASFFIVPARILNLPGLTLAYLKVYETIFQFWNHGKDCYLSDEKIMERTGLLERTVRNAYIFFEKCKELERRKIKGRRYFIQPFKSYLSINNVPTGTDLPVIAIYNQEENSINNIPTGTDLPVDRHYFAGSTGTSLPHNKKKLNKKNLSKSFYKDNEQKENNKQKHDFSPMMNEAASIKKNEENKKIVMPPEIKEIAVDKKPPKEKDNQNNQEAMKIMSERVGIPLNNYGERK